MVSSATYPQLDPTPPLFSPAVLGLLRGRLGFDGVVVSDDVGARRRRSTRRWPGGPSTPWRRRGGRRADRQPGRRRADDQALSERAAADPAFADRVEESAGRVLALKERFGLLTC